MAVGTCGRGRCPRRPALGAGRPTVVRRGYGRSARVRPRQARPSRAGARDFTSESFHRVDMRRVGARSTRATLGAGRPTVVRHGCGRSARVRPRQARPSRMGVRDFTSESFRRVAMWRVGARSTRAALGAWRPTVARHGCGRSARVRPRQVRPSRVASRDFTSERSDGRAAIYSTPLHGHSSTSRFDTDRWCTPTDDVLPQKS